MEKIVFDNDTHIWKIKLDYIQHKDELLELCDIVINNPHISNFDAYPYFKVKDDVNFLGDIPINNKLDEIAQLSINYCKEIHKGENIEFNMLEVDMWVNIVRAHNPVQPNYKDGHEKYHIHTEINKANKSFVPSYTYVYYIQMPDNIIGEDGVLYFKGKNNNEYSILPEEGDLIIMEADVPHAPNSALNSTKDRIVFAGNVGLNYVKNQKSLI